jgi:hypothetical protein
MDYRIIANGKDDNPYEMENNPNVWNHQPENHGVQPKQNTKSSYSIWLFNIAMGTDPFIDGLPTSDK